MPRRTRRARRARRGMTIGLLVLASIAIITVDYRGQAHGVISGAKRAAHDAFAPVQRGVDEVVRPVGSFLSGAVHGGDLESQNAKLRAEIGALQRQTLDHPGDPQRAARPASGSTTCPGSARYRR